jgi:2-polyprenyl-3-methyl-5-hydroxy-6-metoxy-1,4-benzoquinol methylase
MRPLQAWARKKRIEFFVPYISPNDRVLEIGPGEGWFRNTVEKLMSVDYVTVDTDAAADIERDIKQWPTYNLQAGSFEVVVAFEVVEHVDCLKECYDLLKPGGLLLLTTPLPHADWLLKILEALWLTQKRTSAHSNLIYLRSIPGFAKQRGRTVFGIGQWGVFRKTKAEPTARTEKSR